jgi:hypothetical protein
MSVSPSNPADGVAPAAGGAPSVPSSSPTASPAPADGLPEIGQTWRGLFHVRKVLPEIGGDRAWGAMHTETMEEVVLRLRLPAAGDDRAGVWEKLESISDKSLLRAHGSYAVGAGRIEVQSVPAGKALSAWRDRSEADAALIERVVQALAAALGALHDRGLVHLAVRPDTVFVNEEHGALQFTLGGLEHVRPFAAPGTVAVDPFYAPPEAVGVAEPPAGPGLCAWDWWSLGRVLQELILGQHVVNLRWQSAGSRMTAELAARAEELLKETDPAGPRAGAVEAMPALDKRVAGLLRGLLTSVRDARWGAGQVGRWLNREAVKDGYHRLRHEPLFRWREHTVTVAEAAELLRREENWREGIDQIWGKTQPDTLARFIAESPAHRTLHQRVEACLQLADGAGLKSLPPAAVREALAAVALMKIAGTDFMLRGHRPDAAGLAAIFGGESGADGDRAALLPALAARPVLGLIEEDDPEAARTLAGLAQILAAAEAVVRRNGWLTEADAAGRTRLVQAALRPVEVLRETNETLHTQFACSSDPAMEKLFRAPQPSHTELVVLDWAAADAPRFGFLTPSEWAAGELEQLRARGLDLARAGLWLRLGRALTGGFWFFARGPQFAVAWAVVALVIALVWPGVPGLGAALALVALAVVIRLAGAAALGGTLRRWIPEGVSWKFHDGVARCRLEAQALARGRPLADLEQARNAINADIAKLPALRSPALPVPPPPGFGGLRAAGVAGWLLVAGVVMAAGWRLTTRPPTWETFRYAWGAGASEERAATMASAETRRSSDGSDGAAAARNRPDETPAREVRREPARSSVKTSWPYKPTEFAAVYRSPPSVEADAAQRNFAAALGARLVAGYKPETIRTFILLRVPTPEKCGVMIYDGRRRAVIDRQVYLLESEPAPRSWIDLAGRHGVYLTE